MTIAVPQHTAHTAYLSHLEWDAIGLLHDQHLGDLAPGERVRRSGRGRPGHRVAVLSNPYSPSRSWIRANGRASSTA
ncbi:hypothetical protein GCM10023353_20880 [Tomitella cavernea]|uniref:Transposase n=1 Tax=Tomitella cavernea TaxID=1387982 RepID=A0ABP9CR57_9ACTN